MNDTNIKNTVNEIMEWQNSHRFVKPLDKKKIRNENKVFEKEYKTLFIRSLVDNIDKWTDETYGFMYRGNYLCKYGEVTFYIEERVSSKIFSDAPYLKCVVVFGTLEVFTYVPSTHSKFYKSAMKMMKYIQENRQIKNLAEKNKLCEENLSTLYRTCK